MRAVVTDPPEVGIQLDGVRKAQPGECLRRKPDPGQRLWLQATCQLAFRGAKKSGYM